MEDERRSGRPTRIGLAAALLAVALLTVVIAIDRVHISSVVPGVAGAQVISTVRPAGVLAVAVASCGVLCAASWLIWVMVRRPARRWWALPAGTVMVAGVVTAIVALLPTPTF